MKFNPRVSIVIPVYNGSNYLREAIDSALAQTYKNIEIIVVNDGSIDNGATEKIAKSYGSKIRYFNKKNGGVATALNYGIKKMTGDYFSWLSHDDLYYPDKIEKQIKFLYKMPNRNVVLYSNYSLLQESEFSPVFHDHEMLIRKPKYSLLRGCVNGITVLVPKHIIDDIGLFDSRLKCTQDYDYWLRIQEKFKFVHMKDLLSITRLHDGQDTNLSNSVVQEGNQIWMKMINLLTLEEKNEYEGTLFNFYVEMAKFLRNTPYDKAYLLCKRYVRKLTVRKNPQYKVSVIIPFFNNADETIDALTSVIGQTYKNIEIILINDCSTDNIIKINRIAKTDDRIKLINLETNSGPAVARNRGIEEASGEYLAFLDSDDTFAPRKIEKQLNEMIMRNPIFSHTSYRLVLNGKREVRSTNEMSGIVVPKIIKGCSIATPTVMVKRKFLIDNNLMFDENIRIGEDVCFWMNIAKHTTFLHIDEPLSTVNAGHNSHAYDIDKQLKGTKNILSYLLQDDFYSKDDYSYELSCLANRLHVLCEEKRLQELNSIDKYNNLLSTKFNISKMALKKQKLSNFRNKSKSYAFARAIYYEGVTQALRKILLNKL